MDDLSNEHPVERLVTAVARLSVRFDGLADAAREAARAMEIFHCTAIYAGLTAHTPPDDL